MEKKSSLRFSGRGHARSGVISTVIAGIAWCVFLALCVRATVSDGMAEPVVGTIGIVDAIASLVGMLVGFKGFQEREVYYVMPAIGVSLNGILFVIYFCLYIMGIAVL